MPSAIAAAWLVTPAARLRLQSPSLHYSSIRSIASPLTTRPRGLCCHVSIRDDPTLSSSFSEKIGRQVRVSVPLRVYHVVRLPELDLKGMIGVVKQYVGVWKGKRISPNLPYKVEFLLPVDGQAQPVKFFAHLREGEIEFLTSSDQ